jgi:tetratricopeptide (TPR) repeat protein
VLPIRLAVFYPLVPAVNWVGSILGAVVLVAGSWLAVVRLRSAPWLAVGWCWFLGTLIPVIGLVQVGGQRAADRYTYVALVGVFLAAVWWLRELKQRRALAVAVLGVCVVLTHFQIGHWRDGKTLYRHALAVTKDNYLALYNLARLHLIAAEYPAAAAALRDADRIIPQTPEILLNLGTALHEGRISAPEAERCYREAARLDPDNAAPLNNLGNLLSETGRAEAAPIARRNGGTPATSRSTPITRVSWPI